MRFQALEEAMLGCGLLTLLKDAVTADTVADETLLLLLNENLNVHYQVAT